MKRLVVRIEYELELPDHARLEDPIGDEGEMLFLHGRYLEPTLEWLQLEHIDTKGHYSEVAVSDELEEVLNDAITGGTVSLMEISAALGQVDGQRARPLGRTTAGGSHD